MGIWDGGVMSWRGTNFSEDEAKQQVVGEHDAMDMPVHGG